MDRPRFGLVLLCLALATTLSAPLCAQGRTDVVRGRVAADNGAGVPAARVVVTRAADRAVRTAVTDAAGRYTVDFPAGAGKYLVQVTAAGWQPFRGTFTRTGADSILVADVRLAAPPTVALEGITALGRRTKPLRGPEFGIETGGAESLADGVVGALAPGQEGDLDAIAATLPGVLGTPQGLSVLGLGPGQIQRTLNGMAFSGAGVPRDAKTRTRVSTSAYDPSRGGFGGAQVALELSPGNAFTFRRAHVMLDAPPLQYTDGVSERLGGRFTSFLLSAGGDGALVGGRFYYNMAAQASRRAADAVSLGDAGPDVLRLAGVSADSAERALGLLAARGIPVSEGAPESRTTETLSYIGRIDHTPGADRTWSLVAHGHLSRTGAADLLPTITASSGSRGSSANAGLQGAYSFYFGKNYLNETRSAFSFTRAQTEPYLLRLPGGSVEVASEFGDGAGGLATLTFGGGGLASEDRGWTWETVNETQWYNRASRHKFKIHAQSRLDGYTRARSADGLGTFGYSSLEDLAADRPSSFSRTLDQPSVSGRAWSGALAVGDLWSRSPAFQLLYGVRLEANRFLSVPDLNPAVLEIFGARTDRAPNSVHLSPRVGFTWVYRKARQNPNTMNRSALGSRFQGPVGVLRGGVGEFRNLLPPALLSDAALETGLPGGARRLLCLGPAVPTPDWEAYARDPSSIPAACASRAGGSVFADSAPGVRLFHPSYTAPRSWRGNLAWNSRWRKLNFSVEGVYSLNLNQPGVTDLNFAGEPVFTLAAEGGRPVFVSPSSIVPGAGTVSPVEGRRSGEFGRIANHLSDLRSESRQVTVRLAPDLPIRQYYLGLAYTLSDTRAQARGFDGATFGSPNDREWAPSPYDARHQFLLQAGWGSRKLSVTLFGSLASGRPFTPLVGGDVNGDGLANDRAFVFDPATLADPVLAEGMQALLASAPSWARGCLERQRGRPAGRNSCRGPWTQSLNARVELTGALLRTRRLSAAVTLANPLGGLDQLLHGAGDLRGWGAPAAPDPVLYEVRGFDPATRSFRYAVNPRFGDTRPTRTLARAPFRLTIDFNINWGPSIEGQQLRRTLRPGGAGGPAVRLSVDSIKELYARTVPDIYDMILLESDSLLLSPEQTRALRAEQARYRVRVDSIWEAFARYLAATPEGHDAAEALRRQEEATDRAWEVGRQEESAIRAILSPLQQAMLPELVRTLIDSTEKIRILEMGHETVRHIVQG